MTRDELIAKRSAAEQFCNEHAVQCIRELIEWQDTSLLCNGKLRELARLCEVFMGNHDGLRGAERMVERRALELALAAAPTAEGEPK